MLRHDRVFITMSAHQRRRNVAKVTKYLTDMREMDAVNRTMNEYPGDHRPASTLVSVNNLRSPGARVELDMIAVGPS